MPYPVTRAQRDDYRRNGFITLPRLFSASDIAGFERDISAAVARLHDPSAPKPPNSESNAYTRAFTQVMNLWQHDENVRAIVFNQTLAAAAAQLMGVAGVRLYHDQALYKAARGGLTPWHCDQYYWPLATDNTITAWIPLQDTPVAMGSIAFSAGSHRLGLGRDLPIGEDSEQIISEILHREELEHIEQDFRAGDVSFHAGWTFHHAGPNLTDQPRRAMTVIYMESSTRLKQPENPNQAADRLAWCPGTAVGEVVASSINPVLYTKD